MATPDRKWLLLGVSRRVYCDSSGHHHFFARFAVRRKGKGVRRVEVEWFLDGTTDKAIPDYADVAIRERIGFDGPEHYTVYEKDRDGNERTDDLRYHDAAFFADRVRKLYPLPF